MFDLMEIECQEDSKTDGSCTRLSHDFVSQNLVLDLDNCQKIVNFDQDTIVARQSLEFPFLLSIRGHNSWTFLLMSVMLVSKYPFRLCNPSSTPLPCPVSTDIDFFCQPAKLRVSI